jgi:hypothetical protein
VRWVTVLTAPKCHSAHKAVVALDAAALVAVTFRDARQTGKPEPKVSGTCCAPARLLLKGRTYGCAGEPVPTRFALARGQSGLLREWNSPMRSHIATGLEYIGQCAL